MPVGFFVRGPGNIWNPTQPAQTVWIRQGGAWVLVRAIHSKGIGDGVGPWIRVYDAYPLVPPTGAATNTNGGGGTGIFTASNRQGDWRIEGTVEVFNAGMVLQTSSTFDVLSNTTSFPLGGVTPGTVRFTVRYRDTVTNAVTAYVVFDRAYTLPS